MTEHTNISVKSLPFTREFLKRYSPDSTRAIRPPAKLMDQDPQSRLIASDTYASTVQHFIDLGYAVAIVDDESVPAVPPKVVRSNARLIENAIKLDPSNKDIRDLLASCLNPIWKLEDGSSLVDGIIQIPPGELWAEGNFLFTGKLAGISPQDEFKFTQGILTEAPARWRTAIGKPLVEIGFGCNDKIRCAEQEKMFGVFHIGVGAVSPNHLYPPDIHIDIMIRNIL